MTCSLIWATTPLPTKRGVIVATGGNNGDSADIYPQRLAMRVNRRNIRIAATPCHIGIARYVNDRAITHVQLSHELLR